MRGHIKKRGLKSWSIVLYLGRDAAGKRRQKWHTVKGTKRNAERELSRLLNEVNTGTYVEPSRMAVGDYLERWLRDSAKLNVSPKTYERYREICEKSIGPAIGHYRLSELRPLQIQSFYTDAMNSGRKDGHGGLSPRTVLHFHRVLHKALDQAVRWQLLARNPADAVDTPKPGDKEMDVLDGPGVAILLDRIKGTRLSLPTMLAVTTGMRRGELLALTWKNVDLNKGEITVTRTLEQTREGLRFKAPKTKGSRRNIALMRFTIDALRRHKAEQAAHRLAVGPAYADNGLVVARPDGTPWAPNTFSNAFVRAIKSTKLPTIRFHDLRHTHATLLLKQGTHPKIVSERLGHSKVGITLDTYSHVLPGMQDEATQLLDVSFQAAMRSTTAADDDTG